MTRDDMVEAFAKASELCSNTFELVENKRSGRQDIHAFLLLDELLPGTTCIVADAERDKVWLDVDLDELTMAISEEDIVELARCGVWLDDDEEGLCMYP